jgi:hypothetical protein
MVGSSKTAKHINRTRPMKFEAPEE